MGAATAVYRPGDEVDLMKRGLKAHHGIKAAHKAKPVKAKPAAKKKAAPTPKRFLHVGGGN